MDKKLQAETWALLLLFAAFPITSWGATQGSPALWWLGLISLIAGGILPIVTRFMDHSNDTIRDTGMEYDDRPS
jgi:4-hydroxybenzoate polyprenyltransferase